MKKKIVFRLDCGKVIGSGHLMRCLAMARVFKRINLECIFITHSFSKEIIEKEIKGEFKIIYLNYLKNITNPEKFERLIFNTNLKNDQDIIEKMKNLKNKKYFKIDKNQLNKIKVDFIAESISEKETEKYIYDFYDKYKYILDPHTAVAYGVLNKVSCEGTNIVLCTAHPSKFPKAISKVLGIQPKLPDNLCNIMNEKENYDIVDNNLFKIKNYILSKI